MSEKDEIIRFFDLKPLDIEGGYYRETFRSNEVISHPSLPSRYDNDRSFLTCIYYLVTSENPSTLHRLISDEIYHFYIGNPVNLLLLLPDGSSRRVILGNDFMRGEHPQFVVYRNVWQALYFEREDEYALLGTTLSPGFHFTDFEKGDRRKLIEEYNDESELIKKLTS